MISLMARKSVYTKDQWIRMAVGKGRVITLKKPPGSDPDDAKSWHSRQNGKVQKTPQQKMPYFCCTAQHLSKLSWKQNNYIFFLGGGGFV
jgi:hypothetical protein